MFEKLKENKVIYNTARFFYDSSHFFISDIKMMKRKDKKHDVIRICILSQATTNWSNIDEVYQNLILNPHFEVYILMIPEFDYSTGSFNLETADFEGVKNFHASKHHTNCIEPYQNGKWMDLKKFDFDYLWYERPYSHYLPEPYRIKNTCTYVKTCYSPYGYEMMNYVFNTSLNIEFFQYLYLFFSDNYVSDAFHKNRSKISHALKIRKTIYTGHPVFNNMLKARNDKNIYWNEKDTRLKVIWAPRWTMDVHLGGSNFLNYKDQMVNYILSHKDTSLVFRPHPLTFKNFISKGMMTQKEADDYLKLYEENEQLNYDHQSEYFSTFWASDVFVGDISSIIPNYFLTGKPIIYCHTGSIDDNDVMKKIFSVSYHADSFEDVERILDDLRNGIDPLKEKRNVLKDTLFPAKYTKEVAKNIICALEDNA